MLSGARRALALAAVGGMGGAALAQPGALAHVAPAGPAAVAPAPVPAPAPARRTVREGETLSAVARSLGVSVQRLAEANGITDVHRIRAGARLVVPAPQPAPQGAAPSQTPPAGAAPARLPDRLRQVPARLALVPHFDAAARDYGVPADLLKALTWLESGWQNDKVSVTRALGIGQLMPDTVAFVNGVLLRARLDPRRPDHNIRLSARYLAYLLHRTDGDVALALAAYYQGLASVRRDGTFPDTHRYVANVLALRQKF